jgi:Rrf2 family nitric oxide-sensitive transcriptional repressor
MQLTLYTDYTLRVLLYLGAHPEKKVTISEIANSYGISKNHLVKIVYHLSLDGYIDTTRGKGGGLSLAIPPEKIRIGDVVRRTEVTFDLLECFNEEKNTCPIAPACMLKNVLAEALRSFVAVVDQYTLADMLGNRDWLTKMLESNKVKVSSIIKAIKPKARKKARKKTANKTK